MLTLSESNTEYMQHKILSKRNTKRYFSLNKMNSLKLTQWFYFSTQETKFLRFFSLSCAFLGSRSSIIVKVNHSVIVWKHIFSLVVPQEPSLWGLWRCQGSSWALNSLTNTAQWSLTTNPTLNELPDWPVPVKKRHHLNFKMIALQQSLSYQPKW